ncbi:TPA: nuclear transport factor 2 family protein [Klebsiella aerogenes]|nr:nuclear transport factor 2 family protein [Klebsiella aerogenes]
MLLEKLKRLECSLHGDKRNDREWLEQILHEEFREITRSGMLVGRAETIEALSAEDNGPGIHSGEFKLISVRDNFAILHYRTFNPDGSNAALRSSCWEMNGNGQWQLLFHQGTPESKRV